MTNYDALQRLFIILLSCLSSFKTSKEDRDKEEEEGEEEEYEYEVGSRSVND